MNNNYENLTDHTIINPLPAWPHSKKVSDGTCPWRFLRPLVFSAFGYIPDTALDFLSYVSVTGSELHLNSWPTGREVS